jgi:D-alanine-D-alanine ligase
MSDISKIFQNLKVRENKKSLKIGVIAGGVSSEREISLMTGKNIYNSLLRSGYNAVFIDPDPVGNFLARLGEIDLAFLALHGKYGEDGTIQGLLEFAGIPYTGSGILGSAIAINKILSKKIFQSENILTPDYIEVELKNGLDLSGLKKLLDKIQGYPVIVKPNTEGSTIGINIVNEAPGLEYAVNESLKYDSKILIEKYIKGRELTVSIIGSEPVALPIIEIKPKSGFYDYQAKYTSGMTEYVVPAELDDEIAGNISKTAIECHKALQCNSISRVDFILDSYNNAYVIELNTMPGMTETSLVPKAAKAAGINFDLLVEIILDLASLKV